MNWEKFILLRNSMDVVFREKESKTKNIIYLSQIVQIALAYAFLSVLKFLLRMKGYY